jgi:hypothetical protein
MKHAWIALLGLCILLGTMSSAKATTATPSLMSYQGQLNDAGGNPLTGIYNMVFTIYDDASLGGPTHIVWQEAQNGTNVRNGLFSVMLGNGTPAVPLSADVFASPDRWLGIKIGADPEIVPRSRLQSVAYSQKVNTIDKARGGIISGKVTIAQATSKSDGVKESASFVVLNDVGDTVLMVAPPTPVSVSGDMMIRGMFTVSDSTDSIAGSFSSSSAALGSRFAVHAESEALSSIVDTSVACAIHGKATCTGDAGYAVGADLTSDGEHLSIGILVAANSPTGGANGGVYVASGQDAGGAHFSGEASTGYSTGVDANSTTISPSSTSTSEAVSGYAHNAGTGDSYGGYFTCYAKGGAGYGVRGSAVADMSGTAYGGYFSAEANGTGAKYALYAVAPTSGSGTKTGIYASAPNTPAGSYAGYFSGKVRITDSLIVMGGKSAAVKDDHGDYRLLYCQESPEVWFEDVGRGQLTDGKAHIDLDPLFLQTVTINEKYPMEVFIQLRSDCNGTYVVTASTGFDITELQNGKSNASFSYRVMAKRKGYEGIRLPLMGGPTPEQVEAEQEANRAAMETERQDRKEPNARMR